MSKGMKYYIADAGSLAVSIITFVESLKDAHKKNKEIDGETVIIGIPKNAGCVKKEMKMIESEVKDWNPNA